MIYIGPQAAIHHSIRNLSLLGRKVESKSWQAIKGDFDTLELLNHTIQFNIIQEHELQAHIKPSLPWADEHFEERIGGKPLNPPPSHVRWPYNKAGNLDHMVGGKFSHTYPERIWPKRANVNPTGAQPASVYDIPHKGIRYDYGDLNDLIKLLKREPETRQAYLPIWFPEDTGAPSYQRVPCTLGYHFIKRHGHFHMTYYIRSCDIIRHFRDDIYLALKLFWWIKKQAMAQSIPGIFTMHIVSLHCFYNERGLLKIEP